ncbi:MAG: S9 family peptidase [Bryobacteraceae bacterium]
MQSTIFFLIAALMASGVSSAQILTPEQAMQTRRLNDLRFSPDGTRIAFVVAEPPKGAVNASHIWVADVAGGKSRQFTSSAAGERSPRWSPDGKWLAFLSARDGGSKLFRMAADGGEASPLFRGKYNVGAFDWSPDGKSIAFTAAEPSTDAAEKKVTDKDDAKVADDPAKRPRLWVLDIESGKPKAIGTAGWQVGEFVWMRDGAHLLVSATPTPSDIEWTESIWQAPVGGGDWKQFATPPKPFGRLQLSPDGRNLAVVATRKDGPSPHDLWVASTDKPVFRNLTASSIDRPVESYAWSGNGELAAIVERGFHTELVRVPVDTGSTPRAVPAGTNPSSVAVHGDAIAFAGETAASLPDAYILGANGAVRKLSDVHSSWRNSKLAKLELLKYKSFDGLEIEAGLLRPDGGTNLPTVVYIHGGPTGRWRDGFDQWQQLLAARGYAVFAPNIRGSAGYGHKFIESNRNDWGGADFKDVMAGVDDMVKRGIADPNRMCIGGWSYGGYMSEWAITQTNRFKCAIAGAGLSDLASEFGTENGASYDRWFFGTPYEHLADFQKSSPITFIKNAKTPTLILQGEADTTDPIGQSEQLYRGLKAYGVEAQLVLYPREGHGIREEKHRIDLLNRMIAWFDKYLKK